MLQKKIRILAAIMFTDMVGYTSMMQEDENRAKLLRDRHRQILEKCISNHTGSILQYYGDGTLSIFGSAIEAVRCAVEIQKELNNDPRIPLRIGIHAGDIVYEDDGVYGDGVNVASRIQALSVPGSIFISGKIFDEIKNQEDLSSVSLGEVALKNVKKPVEIYAINVDGLSLPDQNELRAVLGNSYKSIAVLPFVNMSNDIENEYFSDGITEEIINALTKLQGLKVTSRTSSFAFKGKNDDVRKIGGELNVDTIIEGSVRKSGNKVRITAQLINASDGYHYWSEVFDRELEDIFELQDEIARAIAEKLDHKHVLENKQAPLVSAHTKNIDAYNLYLKGLYYYNKWTPENMQKAISFFEQSVSAENKFVQPHCGIANCYVWLGAMGHVAPRNAYPQAELMALKALSIDDSLAESHVSLALVKLFYRWDFTGAYNSIQKSLSLNSGTADVHYVYSLYLLTMGHISGSLREIEAAYRLDPFSLVINNAMGEVLFMAGRYDESEKQFLKTLELAPDFNPALWHLGAIFLLRGKYKDAVRLFSEARAKSHDPSKGMAPLGMAYAFLGKKEESEKCLHLLLEKEESDENISLNFEIACFYLMLNQEEEAFRYLWKAYDERAGGLIFLDVHPLWKKMKDHSKFIELKKMIGLPFAQEQFAGN